ncbi:molybdenum cofactor guanylyltransferase [Frondihabitans sucicola]|uniref:molybdenum cofactor guanylyltransferase n=1 Tax=Frondihabitans sucicola TaxID=1268041 RepID=UPI00257361B8|nr:NTP transferase domain-containing protein [Frondihabitans sucicola]
MSIAYTAVLLAGGRASRLGGLDKTRMVSRGATLLDRAIEAAQEATALVIVGLRDGTAPPARAILTREDPPWSGPVAALAAGLQALPVMSPSTLVLACDLPRAPEAARALLAGARGSGREHDGFVAVDDAGYRQPLLAVYRTEALLQRLAALEAEGPLAGLSLRRLLADVDLVEVPVPTELCADVDTPADAARLGVGGAAGEGLVR